MQILGKRSKVLLAIIAIVMLIAVGVSFATWDTRTVKATNNGDLGSYANAKVGDIIEFGKYYQTLEKYENGEYIKTPIEWIVVDKDERTGQLTLMSKYILACGSYFGNYYVSESNSSTHDWNYTNSASNEVAGVPTNQAYVESTVRAYLNNLERLDMGGDSFDANNGYLPSNINSTKDTGLLSNIGYSNQKYLTNLDYKQDSVKVLVGKNIGFSKRYENDIDVFYSRPIESDVFKERPMTRGFFDEAFSNEEKTLIVPKNIPGYIGHRWPDIRNDISTKGYVEGSVDKVWLPSATELNIINGHDWNGLENDAWTNPSDASSSTVFEYFKYYSRYRNPFKVTSGNNTSVDEAIYSKRTDIAYNGIIGNYSIPNYIKGTTNINTDISSSANSSDRYWTRSPSSPWYLGIRIIIESGRFRQTDTFYSYIGVRPCINLKY